MEKTVQRPARQWGAAGRRLAAGLGVLALAAALSACSGFKNAPDEFAVVRSAPLTLPPDYQLRPPQPGAARPNVARLQEQAEEVLLEEGRARRAAGDAAAPAASPGEAALIERAGAADVDPNIRHVIDREFGAFASEDEGFFESLLFWQPDEAPGAALGEVPDEVIDPVGESERLRENAVLGKPATAGDTPVIKRREKALLEGLF